MLGSFQFARIFGEEDPQRSQIMLLARHGIAEDHRGAVRIERPLGIAVVFQGFARASDGPLLRAVHGIDDARRNGQVPLHRIPGILAHPSADLGIRFIGRILIGIEVERGIPAVGIDISNAVTPLF